MQGFRGLGFRGSRVWGVGSRVFPIFMENQVPKKET